MYLLSKYLLLLLAFPYTTFAKTVPKCCKAEEFQCNNNNCIADSAVSNGIRDCPNGEDEQGYESAYACEGHSLDLYCRRDEVLSIINANYGRLSSKICTNYAMYNQNCRAATSHQMVKERCNEKGTCSIPSSNALFGDPCAHTIKYLEVHYECVQKPSCTKYEFQCTHGHCIDSSLHCDGKWDCTGGEDESACSYITEIACEHSMLNIGCKEDEVIRIIGANYGRQFAHICTHQTTLNCSAPTSTEVLTQRCDKKRFCSIRASNEEFGDPCVGTIKYLSVHYECVSRNTKKQTRCP